MNKKRAWLCLSGALFLFAVVFLALPIGYDMAAAAIAGPAALIAFYTLCRNRLARILMGLFLVLGFGCFLAAELTVIRGAHSDADTDADYLIVMGAGIRGTDPSPSMQDRLLCAKDWLDEHPDALVIVSGSQARDESASEAAVMYAWLTEHGVDPARIIPENKADSSYENIVNSLALIEAAGGDPSGCVAFVSSEYHLCRIRRIASHLGCEPRCIAAPTSLFSLKIYLFAREAFALWEIWLFGADT